MAMKRSGTERRPSAARSTTQGADLLGSAAPRGQVAALALGAALLGGPTWAQPASSPSEPATDMAPPAPLLTGPRVEEEATDPTLVRLGYDGRIERIADAQPEVAALELLDLDDDLRARIDQRLEDRAAFLDKVVTEQYRTLLELYSAFGAGDQREVIRLYMDFSAHLAPLFEGGGLARQLASEMPAAQRAEYAGLLREYYEAVIADAHEHPEHMPGVSPDAGRAEILRAYKVELLMQEVGRSFARIIRQKSSELDEVLAALRLTPEREAEVRAMVQEYGQELGLNPTQEQRRAFFTHLMENLSPEERQRLLAWVLR